MLENRFSAALTAEYDFKVKKEILALTNKNSDKTSRSNDITNLARLEANAVHSQALSKQKLWSPEQGPFQDWVKNELKHLRESWIQEEVLKKLDLTDVVDSYNKFIKVMEDGVSPDNLNRIKQQDIEKVKENSNYKQMHVDRLLYGQPQGLNPRLYAPVREMKAKMVIWGMVCKGGKPKASGMVFNYHEISIIEYYRQKAFGFLNYYRPATNYHAVKKLVDYHMRWSLIHTLAGKNKKKVHQIIYKFGKTPKFTVKENGKLVTLSQFLTPNDINHKAKGFTTSYDPIKYKNDLEKPIIKLSIPKVLFADECAVQGCDNRDIEVHHVRALSRKRAGYKIESIKNYGKRISGLAMIESALTRKQIPLCKKHHAEWHKLTKNQLEKKYTFKTD